MLSGGRPTTFRSDRSSCTTTRCCVNRSPRSTSSTCCSGTGAQVPDRISSYAHLIRLIRAHDLDMIYMSGPGHGGPALAGNAYLEGTCSETYPEITQDLAGLKKLFTSRAD
jgi:XFP N-terminal domain